MRLRVDTYKFVEVVLATGVMLSLLILLWGSYLLLTHPQNAVEPGQIVQPGSIWHILTGVTQLDPTATINLGLLVLLIAPIARVTATLISFALERNNKYASIAALVLVVLLLSATLRPR